MPSNRAPPARPPDENDRVWGMERKNYFVARVALALLSFAFAIIFNLPAIFTINILLQLIINYFSMKYNQHRYHLGIPCMRYMEDHHVIVLIVILHMFMVFTNIKTFYDVYTASNTDEEVQVMFYGCAVTLFIAMMNFRDLSLLSDMYDAKTAMKNLSRRRSSR